MKIGIIGDIHGNLEALTAVLEAAEALGVQRYVCIGDIVGYNANPHECMDIVRGLDLITVVKGNHDAYVSINEPLTNFNPQAAAAVYWTRQHLSEEELKWLNALPYKYDVYLKTPPARFTVVHATLDNPTMWGYVFDRYTASDAFQYQWMPVCFFGHTHTPLAFEKYLSDVTGGVYSTIKIVPNHKYLINVGSVGQPRDRDPRAAFATYDVESGTIQLHRVEYDVEAAQQKIIAAGLPLRCAERLAVGQ